MARSGMTPLSVALLAVAILVFLLAATSSAFGWPTWVALVMLVVVSLALPAAPQASRVGTRTRWAVTALLVLVGVALVSAYSLTPQLATGLGPLFIAVPAIAIALVVASYAFGGRTTR